MEHLAILDKKLGLIPKIISGEKDVESRWYLKRRAPWNRVEKEDIVYFKNAGGPVIARARVSDVLQYQDLGKNKVEQIINQYESRLGVTRKQLFDKVKYKRYCVLIFLKNPQEISNFEIDKRKGGFACGDAWLVLNRIDDIRCIL